MLYRREDRLCGCWYPIPSSSTYCQVERRYLPQVELSSSTTILATTSRTVLRQRFVNTASRKLDQVQYTFPLYDGVTVVGFTCSVGDTTVVGVVKEKQQARTDYQEAVARGETAGLLQQLPEASDVFTTSVGNVPANEAVQVDIVYLGELKHDAETDGSRFTIPTIIAPRYGSVSADSVDVLSQTTATDRAGISIAVDVTLDDGSVVRGLQSPSHPIAVVMGRTSSMPENAYSTNHASATLTLGTTELGKDFVVVVLAKGNETPRALVETHPSIPHQRAVMATLVPCFNIPNISPEIVFVVDRSGSMEGKIDTVVSAMKIFLKSLPLGIKFNICSFGSRHSFLFKKSKTYDQASLKDALKLLEAFAADYGGTEMLQPVQETIKRRFKDLPLEVMILTDGEIWNQDELFACINATPNARFFTLGIGDGASSALVEGIARAGGGFAQFVGDNEKMDKRVVRMLKAAVSPHITDYRLEVTYAEEDAPSPADDFEMVDVAKSTPPPDGPTGLQAPSEQKTISLFDTNAAEEPPNPPTGRYDNLPAVTLPAELHAPQQIPALYPFNRTTAYVLLGPDAPRKTPRSVILRGTSEHGPLELEFPIQDVGVGATLHQLAAKKTVHELEQGRGWITEAQDAKGRLVKDAHEGKWDLLVEREAVRLGVLFQVGGKFCSFVAVEKNARGSSDLNPPAYADLAGNRAAVDRGFGRGSSESPPLAAALLPLPSFDFPVPPPTDDPVDLPPLPSHLTNAGGSFGGLSFGQPAPASASSCFAGAGSSTLATHSLFGNAQSPAGAGFGSSTAGLGALGQPSRRATGTGLFAPKPSPSIFSNGTNSAANAPTPPPSLFAHTPCPPTSGLFAPADSSVAESKKSKGSPMLHSSSLPGGVPRMARGGGGLPAPVPPPAPSVSVMQQMQIGSSPSLSRGGGVAAPMPAAKRKCEMAGPPPPESSLDACLEESASRIEDTLVDMEKGRQPSLLQPRKSSGKGPATRSNLFARHLPSVSGWRKRSVPTDDNTNHYVGDGALQVEGETACANLEANVVSLSIEDRLHKVIELQNFDGSWTLSDILLQLIGISQGQARHLPNGGNETVKATALAIGWLRTKVSTEKDVWELVVDKGIAWLEGSVGAAAAEAAVEAAAKAF